MSDTRSGHKAKSGERTRQPLKVLLVEDMENDALLVLRQLEKDGFEPIHQRVYDPEAMTRALREKEWDVVLSDYSMPQFKAPDALAILQKSGLDLPFIVISGTVGEDVAVETMRAGAHDYFMKGTLKRLGEAVRREMDAARQRRERKAIASELRDSEAKFSIAFALNPLGVGIADLDGRLAEVNQSFCEIVGFPRGEIIGKTVIELGSMQSHERERIIQRAESAGGVLENIETRFHRPDGTVRDALLSLHPISLKGRPHRLVSVFDITKRKRAEERQVLHARLLSILNQPSEWEDLLRGLLAEIKNFTGFDAVAIRLRQKGDFPYHVYNGFSAEFVQRENSLRVGIGDDAESDEQSRLQMDCTCGMVISGDTPRHHPYFTEDGSFWCNDTTTLLELPKEQDPTPQPARPLHNRGLQVHCPHPGSFRQRNRGPAAAQQPGPQLLIAGVRPVLRGGLQQHRGLLPAHQPGNLPAYGKGQAANPAGGLAIRHHGDEPGLRGPIRQPLAGKGVRPGGRQEVL